MGNLLDLLKHRGPGNVALDGF